MFCRKQLAAVIATLLIVSVCLTSAATACPTCRDGLANDPAGASLIQGYFWSICFMMSMPFLILGGVSAYFYYEVRCARARQLAAEARASQPADLATSESTCMATAIALECDASCEEPALVH